MTEPYYEDDAVTIYHADCREMLGALEGQMWFVDPPYGNGTDYGNGEPDTPEALASLLSDTLPVILAAAPPAVVFVTPGIWNLWAYPEPSWVLAWTKLGSMGRNVLGGFNAWEPVLMYGHRRFYQDVYQATTGAQAGGRDFRAVMGHPCPKPRKLLKWLVENATEKGEMVVDPYMGSGTTLRAAKDLGRKAVGIEQNERFCEIAAKRMAQLSML